ncbi:hypothetical protein TPAU25S_00907 [Tsukamurella paurometabola]
MSEPVVDHACDCRRPSLITAIDLTSDDEVDPDLATTWFEDLADTLDRLPGGRPCAAGRPLRGGRGAETGGRPCLHARLPGSYDDEDDKEKDDEDTEPEDQERRRAEADGVRRRSGAGVRASISRRARPLPGARFFICTREVSFVREVSTDSCGEERSRN